MYEGEGLGVRDPQIVLDGNKKMSQAQKPSVWNETLKKGYIDAKYAVDKLQITMGIHELTQSQKDQIQKLLLIPYTRDQIIAGNAEYLNRVRRILGENTAGQPTVVDTSMRNFSLRTQIDEMMARHKAQKTKKES